MINSRSHTPAGRRASASVSPVDQLKPQIDFQFLNFSHPSEAKTGKTRKAVRSHVTKQQHQRENAAAAARRAKATIEEKSLTIRPHAQFSQEQRPSSESTQFAGDSESSSPSLSPSASPSTLHNGVSTLPRSILKNGTLMLSQYWSVAYA